MSKITNFFKRATNFFKCVSTYVAPQEPQILNNKLLSAIDNNESLEHIKQIIESDKESVYQYDENYDCLCHAISNLNTQIVDYLINLDNIVWDYSTALFVLSSTPCEKNDNRLSNIYRNLLDKCGTSIFTGYEFINALNRKNKTLLYLLILDGILDEPRALQVIEKSNLEVDLEMNIFIRYYKNLYNMFKNLKDKTTEGKCPLILDSNNECTTECKQQDNNCCTEGKCALDLNNETSTECTTDCKQQETKSEIQNDLEETRVILDPVEFSETKNDDQYLLDEVTNNEEVLREVATKEVLDKILDHMKNIVDNEEQKD